MNKYGVFVTGGKLRLVPVGLVYGTPGFIYFDYCCDHPTANSGVDFILFSVCKHYEIAKRMALM